MKCKHTRGNHSILEDAERLISDLEDIVVKQEKGEQKKKRQLKKKHLDTVENGNSDPKSIKYSKSSF